MSDSTDQDRIENVAPGDLVVVDRGSGEQSAKVVFIDIDREDGGVVITFETDDGETFDVDYAAGTVVTRTLESKWESEQSPTAHDRS